MFSLIEIPSSLSSGFTSSDVLFWFISLSYFNLVLYFAVLGGKLRAFRLLGEFSTSPWYLHSLLCHQISTMLLGTGDIWFFQQHGFGSYFFPGFISFMCCAMTSLVVNINYVKHFVHVNKILWLYSPLVFFLSLLPFHISCSSPRLATYTLRFLYTELKNQKFWYLSVFGLFYLISTHFLAEDVLSLFFSLGR